MLERKALIGGYELIRRIGRGGMAEVWVAQRVGRGRVGKFVAVKVVDDRYVGDPRYARMFRAEAELSSLLNHANIVQAFDEGEQGGRSYLVMEWIDGVNLLKLQSVMNVIEDDDQYRHKIISYIIGQLLHALSYAHSIRTVEGNPLGVVHRDVSPQNVLISNHGEVKLTDFGVAHHVLEESSGVHVKGKLRYMAPEQLGGKTRDPRVDLYAVGAILHELLDGRRFRHNIEDQREMYLEVLSGKIPSLTREVPPELEALRSGLLAPEPAQRIPSADAALEQLEQFSGYGDARRDLKQLCGTFTGIFQPRVGPGRSRLVPGATSAAIDFDESDEPTKSLDGKDMSPPSPAAPSSTGIPASVTNKKVVATPPAPAPAPVSRTQSSSDAKMAAGSAPRIPSGGRTVSAITPRATSATAPSPASDSAPHAPAAAAPPPTSAAAPHSPAAATSPPTSAAAPHSPAVTAPPPTSVATPDIPATTTFQETHARDPQPAAAPTPQPLASPEALSDPSPLASTSTPSDAKGHTEVITPAKLASIGVPSSASHHNRAASGVSRTLQLSGGFGDVPGPAVPNSSTTPAAPASTLEPKPTAPSPLTTSPESSPNLGPELTIPNSSTNPTTPPPTVGPELTIPNSSTNPTTPPTTFGPDHAAPNSSTTSAGSDSAHWTELAVPSSMAPTESAPILGVVTSDPTDPTREVATATTLFSPATTSAQPHPSRRRLLVGLSLVTVATASFGGVMLFESCNESDEDPPTDDLPAWKASKYEQTTVLDEANPKPAGRSDGLDARRATSPDEPDAKPAMSSSDPPNARTNTQLLAPNESPGEPDPRQTTGSAKPTLTRSAIDGDGNGDAPPSNASHPNGSATTKQTPDSHDQSASTSPNKEPPTASTQAKERAPRAKGKHRAKPAGPSTPVHINTRGLGAIEVQLGRTKVIEVSPSSGASRRFTVGRYRIRWRKKGSSSWSPGRRVDLPQGCELQLTIDRSGLHSRTIGTCS